MKKNYFSIPFIVLGLFILSLSIFNINNVRAQTNLETLLANLKSPNEITRCKAAKELGERRFREASVALSESSRVDTDSEVRAAAVESLGRIKDFSTIPTVVEVLKDTNPSVRRSAIRSAVSFYIESDIGFLFAERKGLNYVNPFLDTDGPAIVEPYTSVDPKILEALASCMRNDADLGIRRASVRALGVLRATSQIPALESMLQVDPDLRIDIFRVFIKFGDAENGAYAIPYFDDADREVRSQAIFTAGILRTRKAVDSLNTIYNSGKERKSFKTNVNDFFKKIPDRQRIVLEALSLIGDPSSKDIFERNLKASDYEDRHLANDGLARMGDQSFIEPISRNRLKEGSSSVKLAQAFALYRLGRAEFLSDVIDHLDSLTLSDQANDYILDVLKPDDLYPYIRQASVGEVVKILRALGTIGSSESIPSMEPMLRDANPRVVNAANLAIQRIKAREQSQRGEIPYRPEVPEAEVPPVRPRRTNPKDQ